MTGHTGAIKIKSLFAILTVSLAVFTVLCFADPSDAAGDDNGVVYDVADEDPNLTYYTVTYEGDASGIRYVPFDTYYHDTVPMLDGYNAPENRSSIEVWIGDDQLEEFTYDSTYGNGIAWIGINQNHVADNITIIVHDGEPKETDFTVEFALNASGNISAKYGQDLVINVADHMNQGQNVPDSADDMIVYYATSGYKIPFTYDNGTLTISGKDIRDNITVGVGTEFDIIVDGLAHGNTTGRYGTDLSVELAMNEGYGLPTDKDDITAVSDATGDVPFEYDPSAGIVKIGGADVLGTITISVNNAPLLNPRPITYDVKVTGLASGSGTAEQNTDLNIKLGMNEGYGIPEAKDDISVTSSGNPVEFTYDKTSGTVTVAGKDVIDNIEISVNNAPKLSFNVSVNGLAKGDATVSYGDEASITLEMNEGYELPAKENITAMMGGKSVDFDYDPATGIVKIGDVTDKVEISVNDASLFTFDAIVSGEASGKSTVQYGQDLNIGLTMNAGYELPAKENISVTSDGNPIEFTYDGKGNISVSGDVVKGNISIIVENTSKIQYKVMIEGLAGGEDTVLYGDDLSEILDMNDGYELPAKDGIIVTVGNNQAEFEYDQTTGTISLKNVTGDVKITVNGADQISYKVNVTGQASGEGTAVYGKDMAIQLKMEEGLAVPTEDNIIVTIGDEEVPFSYNDGTVTISGENVNGDIAISVSNVPKETFNINVSGLAEGQDTVEYGGKMDLKLTMESGYGLPVKEGISVNSNGESIDFTYDPETGTVSVDNVIGNVDIIVNDASMSEHNVIFEGLGEGSATVPDGGSFNEILTMKEGYVHPEAKDDITVKMNDVDIDFGYDPGTGNITIDDITGDIDINVNNAPRSSYNVNVIGDATGTMTTPYDQDLDVKLKMTDGNVLPLSGDDISVTAGGKSIPFTYEPSSGDVLVKGTDIRDDVQIDVTHFEIDDGGDIPGSSPDVDEHPVKIVERYEISIEADEGITTDGPATTTVLEGGSYTFDFSDRYGYNVKDVMIDGVSHPELIGESEYTIENIQSDHSIKIMSEKEKVTIGVSIEGKGHVNYSINGSDPVEYAEVITVDLGALVTFTAESEFGYEFDSWAGCGSSTSDEITIAATEPTDIHASFQNDVNLWLVIAVLIIVIVAALAVAFYWRSKRSR